MMARIRYAAALLLGGASLFQPSITVNAKPTALGEAAALVFGCDDLPSDMTRGGELLFLQSIHCSSAKVVRFAGEGAIRAYGHINTTNVHFVVHEGATLKMVAEQAVNVQRDEGSTSMPLFFVEGQVLFEVGGWTPAHSNGTMNDAAGVILLRENGSLEVDATSSTIHYTQNAVTVANLAVPQENQESKENKAKGDDNTSQPDRETPPTGIIDNPSASPAESVLPVKTSTPAETASPAESAPAAETASPAESVLPVKTSTPAETASPAESGSAADSTRTTAAADSVLPDKASEKDGSDTIDPSQPKGQGATFSGRGSSPPAEAATPRRSSGKASVTVKPCPPEASKVEIPEEYSFPTSPREAATPHRSSRQGGSSGPTPTPATSAPGPPATPRRTDPGRGEYSSKIGVFFAKNTAPNAASITPSEGPGRAEKGGTFSSAKQKDLLGRIARKPARRPLDQSHETLEPRFSLRIGETLTDSGTLYSTDLQAMLWLGADGSSVFSKKRPAHGPGDTDGEVPYLLHKLITSDIRTMRDVRRMRQARQEEEEEEEGAVMRKRNDKRKKKKDKKTQRGWFPWGNRTQKNCEIAKEHAGQICMTIDDHGCVETTVDGIRVSYKCGRYRFQWLNRLWRKTSRDCELRVPTDGMEVTRNNRFIWGLTAEDLD